MTVDPQKVLRLNFPMWQGGDRAEYRLGSRLLSLVAPEPLGPVETVEVPDPATQRKTVSRGVAWREVLLAQLHAAQQAIQKHQPDGIVTLGGDCLADLPQMAYLSERYGDDLAVLWIDTHPDIQGPAQSQGANAHVLAILLGQGDAEFVNMVPRPVKPEQVLYVGLNDPSTFETEFIEQHGLTRLSPELASSEAVMNWLRQTGARRLAVHFDVDVLNPAFFDSQLTREPDASPGAFEGIPTGKMRLEQVIRILQAVAAETEMVGLAITEYLPWSVIKFADELKKLPLLGVKPTS